MARVLILFAHPAFEKSRVNVVLLDSIKDVDQTTFHDLYETYPDFDIDVTREQELLLAHDIIIVQHPFYWYSTPAIVKEWEDLVLEHGWAYGSKGDGLKGKYWLSVVTAGGSRESYRREGTNHFSVRELLAPLEQTAQLCGLIYLPPFVVFGTHGLGPERLQSYGQDYGRLVRGLTADAIDLERSRSLQYLNDDLDSIFRE